MCWFKPKPRLVDQTAFEIFEGVSLPIQGACPTNRNTPKLKFLQTLRGSNVGNGPHQQRARLRSSHNEMRPVIAVKAVDCPCDGQLGARTSDTSQRKFRRNFRVTDIQQLFNHHSSYTTHQISWQVQQFVNLHVQISWQVQYKMRFREIADARNAVFFNRTGGFEPGKSSSAERLLRDGLGSCSVGRPL